MVTSAAISSALVSGFTTISSDALSSIGTVLPYAMPILGAVIVIRVAISIFKKITPGA